MNFIEEALLSACMRKDRKAQHQLYKLSYSFLASICIRYVKNREDADELVNMGFLKILNNLEKYRREIPFTLWMRRVMINTIIDEYRKNRKEKEMMETIDFNEYHPEFDDGEINDYVRLLDAEYIHVLVLQLPAMSRRVFNLFVVDGYAHKEIAEMLNMSEGTSKWHLNFARNKLKELLSKSSTVLKVAAS